MRRNVVSTKIETQSPFSPTDKVDTKHLTLWTYNIEKGLRILFRLEDWRGRVGIYPGIFVRSESEADNLNGTIHDMEKSGDEAGIELVLNAFVQGREGIIFKALAEIQNRVSHEAKEKYRGVKSHFYTTTKAQTPCLTGISTITTTYTIIPPRITREVHIERYLSPTEKIKRFFTSLKQE